MSGASLVVQLAWLLASSAEAPAAGAKAPAPAPPSSAPAQPPVQTPFRLSLTYLHVLAESGQLTNSELSRSAAGIDMAFPSNSYVRNHLGLAYQWESGPAGYSASGLRIDLVSFGYPIELVKAAVRLELEPIITAVRGEIMFPNLGPTQFRLEGGLGLELGATFKHWFLNVEPSFDFRLLVYTRAGTTTGFGRFFTLRASLGHEF